MPRDIYLDNDKIYTLVKKVGKGGFGTVFKALAKHADDKAVALKICEVQHERADREKIILEKLSGLNHDNIVRFLDASLHHAHHQAHLVIIMELIKGESLEEWLVQRYDEGGQGVTWQASTSIVQQLANGMAAIHSVNVTHRDLKPSNLMFDEHTDILVIVDFGLSKEFNANMTVTADKDAIGTALYMSPEQHDGIVKEISFPADIWAIGIIWHEILTGYVPFESDATSSSGYESTSSARSKRRTKMGTEAKASMYKFLSDTEDRQLPLLIGEIPSNIGKIIARCLYTKQERRYRNAEELFKHVQDVFESLHADGLEQAASLAGENEGEEEISPKMRMGLTESGVRRIVQEISGGGGIRPCIVGFFAKKSSDKEEMKTKVLGWETDPSIGKVEMAEQLKAFLESNTEINVHGEAEELMMGYTHGRSVFDVHVHPQPTFDMFSDCMIHAKERNMRIVHFSGHGNAKCGFFWLKGGSRDYEQVRPMDFVNLFKTEAADSKVGGTIECVILNACETESMGRMLRENGVPHVVCWRKEVQDETAMSFSKIFYKILDSQKTWQNINYSRIFQQVVARCRFEPLRLAAGVDVICLLSKDGDVFTEPTNLGATDRDDATNSEPPSPMNFRGDSSGSGFAASEKIKNKQSREFWEDYFHDTEQVEWSTFARALEQEYNIEERVLPLVQSKMDVNGDGKIGVLEFNIFTKKLGLEVALDELIKRSSVAESKDFACFIAAGGDRCPSVPPPSPPTVTEINEPLSPEPTAPDLPVDRLANFKSGQNDEFDSNEELFRALKASMEEPVQESERDRLTDIGLPFAKLSETRINYVGQGAVLGGVKLRVGFLRLIGAQLACLKDDRNSYKAISPLNECQLTKTTASMSDGQDTGIQVTSKNEKPQVYIFGSLQQRDEWFESLLEVQKLITGGMKLKSNFWQISGKVEVFGFNSQLQLAGIGRNPRGDRARLIVDSPLSNTNPYCELLLRAFEGKEVAGIGLTKKVNRTGMPGWHPGEVGWHGDDLCMFLGNGSGTSCGLEGLDWKAGDRIGCGIMFNGYNAICVFFTRNGALVETVPMKDKEMRYITIGLDSSSFRADLNLSAPLPPSLLSAVSQRNERVKVMGSEGDILTSSSRLDYVQEYISKSPNEKCQISLEPGEYILNNTLRVEKDGIAFSANKGTAVIRKAGDGPVIQCIGKDISLLGITVRVNGGNKSLKSSEGGAIGVQICKDASCILDNCAISTDCGTAVNVQDKGRVVMTNCEIGPCARTGVIVDSGGNASVEIIETSFQQCQNFAMVFNEGRGKVKECNIIGHVGSGRSCGIFVRGPGESTLDVEKTEIRDVGYAIMVSEGGKINLEECTLLDTDIGIDSEGKGSLVNVMKTLFRNSKTCDLKKAGEGGVTHYKCTFVDGAGAEKASPTLFRELAVGDRVRVKKSVLTPAYNWCGISHDSIGTIKSFHGGDVRVDFPQTSGWLGKRIEMELV